MAGSVSAPDPGRAVSLRCELASNTWPQHEASHDSNMEGLWIGTESDPPALSKATTSNLVKVWVMEASIGADRNPGDVKLWPQFNSLARTYWGPTFDADPHVPPSES